nr:immunoglobulin heavy chain junction region [Macaca mulatta]
CTTRGAIVVINFDYW